MTKQERNEVILKALQTELQQKDYAVDVLSNIFELWVQGLVSQGNDLLVNQTPPAAPAQSQEEAQPAPAEEPAPQQQIKTIGG